MGKYESNFWINIRRLIFEPLHTTKHLLMRKTFSCFMYSYNIPTWKSTDRYGIQTNWDLNHDFWIWNTTRSYSDCKLIVSTGNRYLVRHTWHYVRLIISSHISLTHWAHYINFMDQNRQIHENFYLKKRTTKNAHLCVKKSIHFSWFRKFAPAVNKIPFCRENVYVRFGRGVEGV